MLRDFAAGESLAPYDGEFEVPEELRPDFVDSAEDTEESRR